MSCGGGVVIQKGSKWPIGGGGWVVVVELALPLEGQLALDIWRVEWETGALPPFDPGVPVVLDLIIGPSRQLQAKLMLKKLKKEASRTK